LETEITATEITATEITTTEIATTEIATTEIPTSSDAYFETRKPEEYDIDELEDFHSTN
jgi:hypothetical protein